MKFTYAVLTVSDTCSKNSSEDKSGPLLVDAVKKSFPDATVTHTIIVPDEQDRIVASLQMFCNTNINLILTTGGTGLSKRDVTPEATKQVIDREIPGITQTMLIRSLEVTDMAMLSRAIAGTKQNSLIVNLPGSSKGALECFGFIKSIILHAIQLILGQKDDIRSTHKELELKSEVEVESSRSKVRIDQVAMRNRTSPYEMVPFEKALEIVCKHSLNFDDTEEVDIENSLNRVLATDIISNEPFPPFRASIKDGYAIRSQDGKGERLVKTAVAAGDSSQSVLQPNEAVRISTGACVPEGADAVIQVEDTELLEADDKGTEIKIMLKTCPVVGQDIRQIGSDIAANAIVFKRKETIGPAHIGVFATLGYFKVKVYKRPSIGLLSTGNELCPHNAKQIPPGHIRDSNKITLLKLLQKYSYTASDLGIVKDKPDLLKNALATAFRRHDVIITTGGVSMGEFDLMKEVLKTDFDATIHFGRVNMKPGKPTTFVTCRFEGSRKVIFALPGNPVSATVTCTLLVIPGLRTYECSEDVCLRKIKVCVPDTVYPDDRLEFKRVFLTNDLDRPKAYEMGDQISSRLNSCAGAHALLEIPPKKANVLGDVHFGICMGNTNQSCITDGIFSAYVL